MKKKVLSILLSLCMIVIMLPVTAKAGSNVAQNTTTGESYSTLQDAFDAVGEGQTIQLLDNITLTVAVKTPNMADSYTLDLNGKKLSNTKATVEHHGTGTLTIIDSGTGGTVSVDGRSYAIANFQTGTVNISGGTVSANGEFSYAIYNNSTGTVNVTGGEVNASGDYSRAIHNDGTGSVSITGGEVNASGISSIAIYNNDTGSVSIFEGEVIANNSETANAIYNNASGSVSITGGTISASGKITYVICNNDSGSVRISGGAVSSINNGAAVFNKGSGTMDISGGTVSASGSSVTAVISHGTISMSISGGTVSASGDNAEAISCKNGASGTVSISGGTVSASGGSAKAISYENGASGTVSISGGTVSASGSSARAVISYGTISMSISGGTVNASGSSTRAIYNGGSGTVSISGGAVRASGISSRAVVSSGSVSILGGTSTIAGEMRAFDKVPNLSSYANVKITASTTATDGSATSVIGKDAIDTDTKVLAYKYLKFEPKTYPAVDNLVYDLTTVNYDGTAKPVSVTAASGKSLGAITVKYDNNTTAPTNAGTYAVTADIAESDDFIAVTGLDLGTYTINKKALTLKADDKSMTKGNALPTFTYTVNGLANGDSVTTAPTMSPDTDGATTGTFPIAISGGAVTNASNYNITYVSGSLTVTSSGDSTPPTGGDNTPSTGGGTSTPTKNEGKIEKDQKQEGNAPIATLKDSTQELKDKIFSATEQALVAAVKDAKVILKVQDISDSVSEEEKKKIENKLASEQQDLATPELLYVDISLYKKVGEGEEVKVTNTSGKIKISIEVPDSMRSTGTVVDRTYRVVRIHNGVVEILEGTYDPITHLFTFETDRFSTYALTYQDTKKTSDSSTDTTKDKITVYNDFRHLQLTAQAAKTSQTLSYKKAADVDGYLIYGAKCGEEMKLLAVLPSDTISYKVNKLKQGTYYKFQVKAYRIIDNEKVIVITSKTIHSVTESKTYGNPTKVTMSKSSVTLEVGKSKTVTGQVVLPEGRKQKEHTTAIRYESSSKKIATVNSKGKITAKAKGTCYVYAYAQNGVYKRIKITVN